MLIGFDVSRIKGVCGIGSLDEGFVWSVRMLCVGVDGWMLVLWMRLLFYSQKRSGCMNKRLFLQRFHRDSGPHSTFMTEK